MRISSRDLCLGRVLHEDDDLITLEIAKDEHRKLRVEPGDQFLTLMFIRTDGAGGARIWKPWDSADERS